jgi:hypothetical protein
MRGWPKGERPDGDGDPCFPRCARCLRPTAPGSRTAARYRPNCLESAGAWGTVQSQTHLDDGLDVRDSQHWNPQPRITTGCHVSQGPLSWDRPAKVQCRPFRESLWVGARRAPPIPPSGNSAEGAPATVTRAMLFGGCLQGFELYVRGNGRCHLTEPHCLRRDVSGQMRPARGKPRKPVRLPRHPCTCPLSRQAHPFMACKPRSGTLTEAVD